MSTGPGIFPLKRSRCPDTDPDSDIENGTWERSTRRFNPSIDYRTVVRRTVHPQIVIRPFNYVLPGFRSKKLGNGKNVYHDKKTLELYKNIYNESVSAFVEQSLGVASQEHPAARLFPATPDNENYPVVFVLDGPYMHTTENLVKAGCPCHIICVDYLKKHHTAQRKLVNTKYWTNVECVHGDFADVVVDMCRKHPSIRIAAILADTCETMGPHSPETQKWRGVIRTFARHSDFGAVLHFNFINRLAVTAMERVMFWANYARAVGPLNLELVHNYQSSNAQTWMCTFNIVNRVGTQLTDDDNYVMFVEPAGRSSTRADSLGAMAPRSHAPPTSWFTMRTHPDGTPVDLQETQSVVAAGLGEHRRPVVQHKFTPIIVTCNVDSTTLPHIYDKFNRIRQHQLPQYRQADA